MGGPGSGNRLQFGTRNTVESCRSIDIRRFRKAGYIPGPSAFSWAWSREGERVASINVKVKSTNLVILNFRSKNWDEDDWESIEQRVPIDWTACHMGGQRPWFLCPVYKNSRYCGERVAKLYGAGKLFACRHCYELVHQSQREESYQRALTKAQNIRIKLGGSPGCWDPFPVKPKGMHWRTYERLVREYEEAEYASMIGATEKFGFEVF